MIGVVGAMVPVPVVGQLGCAHAKPVTASTAPSEHLHSTYKSGLLQHWLVATPPDRARHFDWHADLKAVQLEAAGVAGVAAFDGADVGAVLIGALGAAVTSSSAGGKAMTAPQLAGTFPVLRHWP